MKRILSTPTALAISQAVNTASAGHRPTKHLKSLAPSSGKNLNGRSEESRYGEKGDKSDR